MSVVACTGCGRVLWAKDGPTCPECLAKQPKPKLEPKTEPKPQEPKGKGK
jgi:hypothetical protein